MRLLPLMFGLAVGLAAMPAFAQTAPLTIMQGGFPSTPTIMQGGFPSGPVRAGFTRPFFPPFHQHPGGGFHHRGDGRGLGRFSRGSLAYGAGGFGYGGFGYGDGGYGDGGYGYDAGGAAADATTGQSQPMITLNVAPPPPPPVSLGVTTETTNTGVTIVRGHTQY